MTELGQSRHFGLWRAVSDLPPGTDIVKLPLQVRFAPIVLKKSFLGDGRKFLGPLMRFVRGDLGDHIFSHENYHGLSYRRYGALQRWKSLKISFREIFGIVRFSTFATVSARNRHCYRTVTQANLLVAEVGSWDTCTTTTFLSFFLLASPLSF
jgi:hypothetical protein